MTAIAIAIMIATIFVCFCILVIGNDIGDEIRSLQRELHALEKTVRLK